MKRRRQRDQGLGCSVCGQVPRQFWLFGGGYWAIFPAWASWLDTLVRKADRLCPGCAAWAEGILGRGAVARSGAS